MHMGQQQIARMHQQNIQATAHLAQHIILEGVEHKSGEMVVPQSLVRVIQLLEPEPLRATPLMAARAAAFCTAQQAGQ